MGKNRSLLNSTHHIIPKSKSGTNNPDNLLEMRDNAHRALHILFSNDTPVEQYVTLTQLNWNVLQD